MENFINNKNQFFIYLVIFLLFIVVINPNSISMNNNIFSINQTKYNKNNIEIPKLAWQPKSHNFGFVQQGNLYNTTFEIWNNGTGILEWSLQKKDNWVNINPNSGMSAGEHDLINVTIKQTGFNTVANGL